MISYLESKRVSSLDRPFGRDPAWLLLNPWVRAHHTPEPHANLVQASDGYASREIDVISVRPDSLAQHQATPTFRLANNPDLHHIPAITLDSDIAVLRIFAASFYNFDPLMGINYPKVWTRSSSRSIE
ncbi:hypothetical protein RhiJN_24228 [Ceratobasidium sp. AG-Ba]|nr:hypothetical protein RhiJN_24228 [Ceratobasidium sp. AG-Ba]